MVWSFLKLFCILRGWVRCHLFLAGKGAQRRTSVRGVRERGVNKHNMPHIYHTNTHVKFAKLRGIKMASHYGKFNILWAICQDWNRHTSKIAYPAHKHPHTSTHTRVCMRVSTFRTHTQTHLRMCIYWHFGTGIHSFFTPGCRINVAAVPSYPYWVGSPPPPSLPPALQRFFSCFTHTILNSIKSLRIRQTCAAPRHVDDATTSTRRHLRDMHSVHAIYWVQREDTGYRVPGAGYSRYSQTQVTFVFSCH